MECERYFSEKKSFMRSDSLCAQVTEATRQRRNGSNPGGFGAQNAWAEFRKDRTVRHRARNFFGRETAFRADQERNRLCTINAFEQ